MGVLPKEPDEDREGEESEDEEGAFHHMYEESAGFKLNKAQISKHKGQTMIFKRILRSFGSSSFGF